MTNTPNTPDTPPLADQQLDEVERLLARTTPVGAVTASPGLLDMLVAEVRRLRAPRRILTENEHSAAWHTIEGAAGEEGADPATVLHAVLRVLGIATPAPVAVPAAAVAEGTER